jgi:hypothetical protein
LGLCYHSPYCPCTQMLKSENLYKPIYFETAEYGVGLCGGWNGYGDKGAETLR